MAGRSRDNEQRQRKDKATALVAKGHLSKAVELFDRIEWLSYDWRMRRAVAHAAPVATNLAAVFVDDTDLAEVNKEMGYDWPWPRQLFGRVVRELATFVEPGRDQVMADGHRLHLPEDRTYLLLHKPVGVVTTALVLVDPTSIPM